MYSMSTWLPAIRQVVLNRTKAHLTLKVNQPSNLLVDCRIQFQWSNPCFPAITILRFGLHPALLCIYVFHLIISTTSLHQCHSYFLGEETKAQRILSNKINITRTIKDGGKIWLQLSLTTKLLFSYYIKVLPFPQYSPRPFGWTGITWLVSR